MQKLQHPVAKHFSCFYYRTALQDSVINWLKSLIQRYLSHREYLRRVSFRLDYNNCKHPQNYELSCFVSYGCARQTRVQFHTTKPIGRQCCFLTKRRNCHIAFEAGLSMALAFVLAIEQQQNNAMDMEHWPSPATATASKTTESLVPSIESNRLNDGSNGTGVADVVDCELKLTMAGERELDESLNDTATTNESEMKSNDSAILPPEMNGADLHGVGEVVVVVGGDEQVKVPSSNAQNDDSGRGESDDDAFVETPQKISQTPEIANGQEEAAITAEELDSIWESIGCDEDRDTVVCFTGFKMYAKDEESDTIAELGNDKDSGQFDMDSQDLSVRSSRSEEEDDNNDSNLVSDYNDFYGNVINEFWSEFSNLFNDGIDYWNSNDHNRIVDSTQPPQPQQHQQLSITKAKPDGANVVDAFGETAAVANGEAVHEGASTICNNNHNINNNNSNNSVNKNNTRHNLSPLLGNAAARNASTRRHPSESGAATTGTAAAAVTATGQPPEKKKVQTTRKLLFQRNNSPQTPNNANKLRPQQSMDVGPAVPSPPSDCLSAIELRQLKLLNRHSCNGRLDYAALERHLERAELMEQHQGKGVEALAILLQYAVHDLDAFACPSIKSENAKAKDSLSKTLHLLEEAKSTCTELQDQLCDKEAYFNKREEELQSLHRCELERVKTEIQMLAQQRIAAVEAKLAAKDDELQRSLDCYRNEMENKFALKQEQLERAEECERELKERLRAVEASEQSLRDRLAETQTTHTARLQDAEERECSLNERLKLLSRELDELKASNESRERELRDKLHLSQDEISVLRTTRRSLNECNADRNMSPRRSMNSSMAAELERLRNEADSLRCVLEMKQTELSKLSKQNEELLRDAEERFALQNKLSSLEAAKELLETELEIKTRREKDIERQVEDLHKAYNHEANKRTRLSYDNEALQWQLKNRSEQLQIVETKLQELSGQDSVLLNASNAHNSSLSFKSSQSGLATMMDSSDGLHGVQCGSPPSSPIIKAVIEKPDSVSWVLEMDDDSPEAAATKMVKRAGSFRSVERSPSIRRQFSMSASAAYPMSASLSSTMGPNPLSQSMSATSVIRPHSNEASTEFAQRSHSRTRSKSMSVKSSDSHASNSSTTQTKNPKKLSRQHSATHTRKNDLVASTWKEPISASSPYNAVRPRTSTMNRDIECTDALIFRRASSANNAMTTTNGGVARKLITCDTSTLNSGEKLEMRSLPTHASVHDLKALKKCQEIQESAGEAMLSGTNSEDEGCSASSDDVISSASTTSGTGTGSTSSLHQHHHHHHHHGHHHKANHMSLEEVLQIEKINSLNGTPMEMSWSDDGDAVFATTSSTV